MWEGAIAYGLAHRVVKSLWEGLFFAWGIFKENLCANVRGNYDCGNKLLLNVVDLDQGYG